MMLPVLKVLFLAQSAIAALSVLVSAYPVDQVLVRPDNGSFINSYIIDGFAACIDADSVPLEAQSLLQILIEMANFHDVSIHPSIVINTIAIIGELATDLPGDSCENAALIDAYVGDNAHLRQALANYVGRISTYIDHIVQLIVNPSSIKFSTGPRGTCLGGGKTYLFEECWDMILTMTNPYHINHLNEMYGFAKRMYNGRSATRNNIASAVTAAWIPQVKAAAQIALPQLANFLRVVASGSNPAQAAANAKASLAQAVSQVKY